MDNLLDIITGYEHKQTARYLEQEKLMRKEAETMEATFKVIYSMFVDLFFVVKRLRLFFYNITFSLFS